MSSTLWESCIETEELIALRIHVWVYHSILMIPQPSTDWPYRVTCKQFYFSHGSGVTQNKNSQVIVTDVRSSYLYCPHRQFSISIAYQVMVRYLNTSQAVCSYHAGPMSPRRLPSHSRSPMRVAKVIRSLWHQSNDALSPVNRPLSQATLRQYDPSECVTFH